MEIIDSGESKFRIWDNDHYSILQPLFQSAVFWVGGRAVVSPKV